MDDKKKVLVIEDESAMRKVLVEELIDEGFIVLQATNGGEGLTIALEEHPDLILLDLKMPVMDGIETLKKLREDSWGSRAEVIILTVFNENEKIAEVLEVGGFDYMVKNRGTKPVIEAVKKKLSN